MLTVRNIYKVCFERGAVESQKPALNPDAKTQAQGSRVFESKDGPLYLKRTAPKSTLIP